MEYIKIKDAMIPLKVQTYNNSKSLKLYFKNGILKIYYNNEVEINEIISYIKEEDKKENLKKDNEEIKNELNNLKEILIKNNIYSRTV